MLVGYAVETHSATPQSLFQQLQFDLKRSDARRSETLLTDVVEDEGKVLSLLTVVLDSNRGGALDLAGVALLVVVAVAEPLTEIHPLVNLDQRDARRLGHGLKENKNGVLT